MTQRKLTTIFAADVQGYSRLMEADEEGTLATLKQYREAMGRLIESHGGRVVNTWGDGLLGEFPSVVEAVRAAVDVQNELAEYNSHRAGDKRMLFRIGINLGDVIVEGEDLYGDGVNIAARLQTQASAGGIVISNTVYDQVRNKVPVGFDFLGNLSVKNIGEGVPSYSIRIGEQASEAAAPIPEQFGREQFGRNAERPEVLAAARSVAKQPRLLDSLIAKAFSFLGLVGIGLVAINLFTWEGEFWAKWPLLAFAGIWGLNWARSTTLVSRAVAVLCVVALFILGINLFSWSGEFWAKWPLLGLAIAVGIRMAMRQRSTAA